MSNDSFVAKLLKQKANNQIEFAAAFNTESLMQTICAFLNSEGGWIVVGSDGQEINGIESGIEGIVSTLQDFIANKIFPQPLVDVRIESFEEKHLVLINVVKGARQPYSYDGKYYIRARTVTKQAGEDEVSLLMKTSNEYTSTWEKQAVTGASIEDIVDHEIRKTLEESLKIGRGKVLPQDTAGFLNYFQLLEAGQVRNGTMVLFGREPVRFISQCRIRITVMPHGKTGSRFDDTVLIEENLFDSYERVQEYFKKNLPLVSEFRHDNWDRTVHGKYPMEAMDEAVLNAMVHRDYADLSGEITINIYRDKIEIINSGQIPDEIITSKNRIKEHHSVLRNPVIAHIFWLRGKIEKVGRGLSLIKNRFTEHGLRSPEWTTQNGYTKLSLYGTADWLELNERMFGFLKQLRIGEEFDRSQYEKYFADGISEKTARNDISLLIKGRWISKIGKGPATKYARTNKELPDIAG